MPNSKTEFIAENSRKVVRPNFAEISVHWQATWGVCAIMAEFFADMIGDDDEDMLLNCFVESKQSEVADATMQKILENILADMQSMETAAGTQLAAQIQSATETGKGDTALIVGASGSGKSTFVKRFFKIILDEKLKKKCLLLNLDLQKHSGNPATLLAWIIETLRGELEGKLYKNGFPDFSDVKGLYYSDYQRMRDGLHSPLYKKDRDAFQAKFAEAVATSQKNRPEDYIAKMLQDAVKNRRLLPCIVFDNVDRYPLEYQQSILQYVHSVRETVPFVFTIIPINDLTIWKLGKGGALQTYDMHSFFLPVPSTKDVISKRVLYLQDRIDKTRSAMDTKEYLLGKGIRVSIENLRAFTACLEDVFLSTDFVSRKLSWLANLNLRSGLTLSKEIMTSPHLSVDDLVASYLVGTIPELDQQKVTLALLLGSRSCFDQGESKFVLNLFNSSPTLLSSPLTKLTVLRVLIDAVNQGSSDHYVSVRHLQMFLESAGVSPYAVAEAVNQFLAYSLVEPFDPTALKSDDLDPAMRVMVTYCGRIHYEMAMSDQRYVEQMALATGVRREEVVDTLMNICNTKNPPESQQEILRTFMSYCLEQDGAFISLPTSDSYDTQRQLRKDLKARWVDSGSEISKAPHLSTNSVIAQNYAGQSHVEGTVKWFSALKGYGFIQANDGGPDIFIHISKVHDAGLETLFEGDAVICDTVTDNGKTQAIQLHNVSGVAADEESDDTYDGILDYFDAEKRFGFVKVSGFDTGVYVGRKVLEAAEGVTFLPQDHVRVRIEMHGVKGGGPRATSIERVAVG